MVRGLSAGFGQPGLLAINNYHYRRGGAEVVFLEQNRLFSELGWRVAPFCMRHPENLPTPWAEHFVDEIEFGREYSLREKAVRAQKITFSVEARQKLDRLLAQFQPDLAHAHNVYHHISPSIFGLLRRRGVPVVLTLHDLKLACPAYKMFTHDGVCERCKGGALHNVVRHRCIKGSLALSATILVESALHRLLGCYARNVDRFVVPSRFYAEKFAEWGWQRERFVHVPNFVEVDDYAPDASVGEAFVYFGRLGPEKGLATLVRAAATARVPVWLVGTGPEEPRLRELAAALGADVRFLGYLSGGALHEAVRRARAVVLPSEWYENAPRSVMEAYALGRPVIGARIGGIPELVRDGETGMVFESGDVESLAEALSALRDLPDSAAAEMGEAGRRWMAREFTPARYRDRLLDLYRSAGLAC